MNKKANIPITILVIGVFALCALAMFTFFVSDFKIGNTFVGLGIMESVNAQLDEYYFLKEKGMDDETLAILFNVTEQDGKKYINSELSYETFSFFGEDKQTVLFSVMAPVN